MNGWLHSKLRNQGAAPLTAEMAGELAEMPPSALTAEHVKLSLHISTVCTKPFIFSDYAGLSFKSPELDGEVFHRERPASGKTCLCKAGLVETRVCKLRRA
jgi:hypothetical protein